MPIRIEWKNGAAVAECDTVAEAIEMMRASASQNGATGTATKTMPVKHEQEKSKPPIRDLANLDYETYFRDQKDNVRRLLVGLYQARGEIKAEHLSQSAGIEVAAFGGLLGAVTKTAKKANISLDLIYTTNVRFDGPRRERWYAPGKALKEHGGAAFNA